ncbi:MAG: Asp-tRNA(Asn)/Glu-tRNA(Gln) amidotransferase subunit GatA [Thermoanaerobacteraceae bacterium]|nr:Asp-tRNA(Asn)/Glu-tRNA(Gln) amidotransferase subunit GatA [Thermoanaerobacteraceae bacterium]
MELYEYSVYELISILEKGETNSVEVTESIIENIDKRDGDIGAFLYVDKEGALKAAEEADRLRRDGKSAPFLGIPVAIKDNICTEGTKTTCASKMLENFVPPYDATVVKKLKEAGAIIVGKTNMDEFAMGSSTENSALKKTVNPWDFDRVPGGSSGGSAAAVAASEVPVALGSDTGGSIRQPASFCGVVGLKPTYGRVSRYGLVAFASSLDQIGPFARDVEDAAMLLNVIAGYDKMDSTSVPGRENYFLDGIKDGIKGFKIGLPKEYYGEGVSSDVRESVLAMVKRLEGLGAFVEETSLPYSEYALAAYYIISSAEASSNLARYDGIRYGHRADKFDDLIDLYARSRSEGFGKEVKRRIMLGTYVLSSGYYDAYYKKALKVRTLIKNDFDRAFEKYDVLISPTSPTVAFKFGEKSNPLEMYLADILTVPVNIAGLPAISVPCGLAGGLPVGLQVIGKPFDEKTLLKIAYAVQENTGKLKPEVK